MSYGSYTTYRSNGSELLEPAAVLDGKVVHPRHVGAGLLANPAELLDHLRGPIAGEFAQLLPLVRKQSLEVRGRVAGVAGGVHDQAAVEGLALVVGDLDRGGDAVGVLGVVVGAAVLESHL